MRNKVIIIGAVILIALPLGLLLVPKQKQLASTVEVLGMTNVAGFPALRVSISPVLAEAPDQWLFDWNYRLHVHFNCTLSDGSTTNYLWHESGGSSNSPNEKRAYEIRLPAGATDVRIVQADGILDWRNGFDLPSAVLRRKSQSYSIAVPDVRYQVPSLR